MKHWVLWMILAVGSGPARAWGQSQPLEVPPPNAAVAWGAKVGLTYANTNFNQGSPPPPAPIATTWRPGFAAGLWVRVALPHRLAVQQEYVFAQLSGEITGGPRYTLRYLSLPLLLRYGLLPRLTVLAGPQFDLLIQAQQAAGGQTTDITHDTEERGVGATAGLEVALGSRLALGARYLQGLNHIGIGQRSAVQEFRFQAVQLSADVRF